MGNVRTPLLDPRVADGAPQAILTDYHQSRTFGPDLLHEPIDPVLTGADALGLASCAAAIERGEF